MSENPELDIQNHVMFAWSVIEHNSIWIQSADNKATASIAVNSLIIGFILTSATELALNPGFTSLLTYLSAGALLLLFILLASLSLSILFAFLCLTSRTGFWSLLSRALEPRIERPSTSLVFFNSIANMGRLAYCTRLQNLDNKELLIDLSEQIYVLSVVASQKHKWINLSFLCLGVALLALIGLGYMLMV